MGPLMKHLAHIRKKDGEEQALLKHLIGVAERSSKFASKIGLEEHGKLIGLLHDLGKYSETFQNYLKSAAGLINPDEDDYIDALGMKGKIDHSTAGAQFIFKKLLHSKNEAKLVAQILSLCIASHHSGLIDCLSPEGKDTFTNRMNKSSTKTHYDEIIEKVDSSIYEFAEKLLSSTTTIENLIRKLKAVHDPEEKSSFTTIFKQGLLIRLLFSCLIDADRLDTADFEEPHLAELRNNGRYQSWDILINRLEKRLTDFIKQNKVNVLRHEISDHCRNHAEEVKGIYLLTVPTGGGKTLASLRFALHHAKKHEMDRIIYVIPYTSIIDQNAESVREFLEDRTEDGSLLNRVVLEHHSNLTPEEETWQQKILSQDWDAPVVFTTSVQVLEALFGSGTRSTRRMHQLAQSVIIFDEVQTMPVRCVHMFNNAINFLVRNCGSTVVLCTATQPLMDKVDKKKGALRLSRDGEMMPDVGQLFEKLKRVQVNDDRKPGGWTVSEVADLAVKNLLNTGSTLVIVNTRKAAQELYEECCQRTQIETHHLSTNMCPAHRLAVLKRIRTCLDINDPKPVLCISTQLIEAGVDVDFGAVIRSIAGLDSIAQAAGRCNRNGLRPMGHVFIVNPDFEKLDKLKDIRIGKEKAERVLGEYKSDPLAFDNDILGPKAIERYFLYYFYERAAVMNYPVSNNSLIGRDDNLLSLLSANSTTVEDYKRNQQQAPNINFRQSFMTAAKVFQSIDSSTRGIIVPYAEGKSIIAELCSAFEVEKQYRLLREAQRYSVNVYSNELKILDEKEQAIHEVQRGTGIYYLDEGYYSPVFGLSMKPVNKSMFLEG
jgi:CRISPR-associated endonuclease/helicase Cas3